MHLVERIVLEIEAIRFESSRRCDQLAFQRISPGVIRADNSAIAKVTRGVTTELRAAVAAGVVKGIEPAPGNTRNDDFLVADGCDEIVAVAGQRFQPPDANPVAVPDCVQFTLMAINSVLITGKELRPDSFLVINGTNTG
jgi:hypothetical protein